MPVGVYEVDKACVLPTEIGGAAGKSDPQQTPWEEELEPFRLGRGNYPSLG